MSARELLEAAREEFLAIGLEADALVADQLLAEDFPLQRIIRRDLVRARGRRRGVAAMMIGERPLFSANGRSPCGSRHCGVAALHRARRAST